MVRVQAPAQNGAGRLWDVVQTLQFAARKAQHGQARLPFALYVRNDAHRPRLVRLVAVCGPPDLDDPQPAIAVMPPTRIDRIALAGPGWPGQLTP